MQEKVFWSSTPETLQGSPVPQGSSLRGFLTLFSQRLSETTEGSRHSTGSVRCCPCQSLAQRVGLVATGAVH